MTAPTPPPHAQRLAAPLVHCAGSVQALLTQTHVNCKAHPCFLLSIFRIKNFNPNMVRAPGYPRPPIRPFERPTFESGKPKCASEISQARRQHSPPRTPTQSSTSVQRRQHSPPRGFSNPTAPGLQSLQAHGPAAVRLSEADSVTASSGLLKSKRCLRIWRVRCRVATYVNIALNLFISPYC